MSLALYRNLQAPLRALLIQNLSGHGIHIDRDANSFGDADSMDAVISEVHSRDCQRKCKRLFNARKQSVTTTKRKHLAARAVMAYRAGFPVALLSVTSSSEHPSDIVGDWKSQRDSFKNDAKLLRRAFAFVYVGSIVNQIISEPTSADLRKEVVSDMSSALGIRQTTVD